MMRKWMCGLFAIISAFTLFGCKALLEHMEFEGKATSEPPQITRTVKRVKCGPNCSDIIITAKLDPTRAKTATFKEIANRQNMTAHEQIHLINTLIDLEYGPQHSHWQPDDVIQVLAVNPTLTHSAKRFLAENIDQIQMSNDKQRDIVKKLTSNPGVADPSEAGVVQIEYTLDDLEIIFCDYYRFEYQVAAELRERGCRADEVTVILFLSCYGKRNPMNVARWYIVPHLPWTDIAYNKLSLDRNIFFVNTPQRGETRPPFEQHPDNYRNNHAEDNLSNDEVVSLVQLKGFSECSNIPPNDISREQNQGKSVKQQAHDYRRPASKPRHLWRD